MVVSIVNLKHPDIDLSSYVGQMTTLKDELASILSKSTNDETSQSKMDRVFMIILLLNLEPDFENIKEQILTRAIVLTFVQGLTQLLRHTSTATQSMRSKITPDNSMMVSQSHSQSYSRGGRGSNRDRGQLPHCTYSNKLATPVIDASGLYLSSSYSYKAPC